MATERDWDEPRLGNSDRRILSATPAVHVTEASERPDLGTVLTSRDLLDADAFSEALLGEISSESVGVAFSDLGLTHVSFWIQRGPDTSVARWEGTGTDTLLERFAASSNPVLARWRGELGMWSGPEQAERFWDASRHRLLSWATGEQGAESEIHINRDPAGVEAYCKLANDFQQDPSLLRLLGRVRQGQGFTRIETWHQQTNGDDVLLSLVEANDLKDAMAKVMAEDNELDRRTMEVLRMTIAHEVPSPSAKLFAHWHA